MIGGQPRVTGDCPKSVRKPILYQTGSGSSFGNIRLQPLVGHLGSLTISVATGLRPRPSFLLASTGLSRETPGIPQ